jgi:hypothetical protein
MDISMRNALIDWRKADLDARAAEVSLRLSALDFDSGKIAAIPKALIETASKLRHIACDILALMLNQPAAAAE